LWLAPIKRKTLNKLTYLVSHMVHGDGGWGLCYHTQKTFELLLSILILSVRDVKHITAYLLPRIRPPFNHLSCLKNPQIKLYTCIFIFPNSVRHYLPCLFFFLRYISSVITFSSPSFLFFLSLFLRPCEDVVY
jgi:hypothetical protein